MTAKEITEQLQGCARNEHFVADAYELTNKWVSVGVGIESVEPILRFMEENSSIDFGARGPLVHFIERFHGEGYEEKLLESVQRKPTIDNIGMLNALINGTKAIDEKQIYISALEGAKWNPHINQNTLQWIDELLQRF